MLKRLWLFVVVGLISAALGASGFLFFNQSRTEARVQVNPAAPPLVYDWVPARSETTALGAGEVWSIGPIPTSNLGTQQMKFRIHLSSSVPITAGFIPASWSQQVADDPTILLNQENLTRMPCAKTNIYDSDVECTLTRDNGDVYFVAYDSRTKTGAFVAGALAGLGIKGPAETALTTNKFQVVISIWQCARNCGDQQVAQVAYFGIWAIETVGKNGRHSSANWVDTLGSWSNQNDFELHRPVELANREALIRRYLTESGLTVNSMQLTRIQAVPITAAQLRNQQTN